MPAMRTGADEAADPKYAHVERERRWLVDPAARPAVADEGVLIEDRYITGTRLRLRRMSGGGVESLKLTKKYDAADRTARPIVTTYLTEAEHALLTTLPARPVVKRRHAVAHGGLEWSLDRFEGALAGLELVEIEAPDAAALAALVPPAWAVREISDDPRYQVGTLAALGLPET